MNVVPVVPRTWSTLVAVGLGLVVGACGGGDAGTEGAVSDDGPPDNDIYLAEIVFSEEGVTVSELENITARAGYDNQPSFTPDGTGLLYTAADEAGRTDIMRYDLGSGEADFLTMTYPESEYSATPLPTGDGFSVVRVEADSTQRLWAFDWDGQNPRVLSDLAPIGYHTWIGENHVVVFVLGDPPSLVALNLVNQDTWLLEESVGRSIQDIPNRGISWVSTGGETSMIQELDPASGAIRPLISPPGEGTDHAWAPDGTLLASDGGQLYWWRLGTREWTPVDMDSFEGELSRLAVSPDGTTLAVVGAR